jgi:hypothetical protein
MPVIVLVVLGQVATAFPDNVRRWTDLTPGAAMTDLVRVSWFGFDGGSAGRTLALRDTWTAAGEPLLTLLRAMRKRQEPLWVFSLSSWPSVTSLDTPRVPTANSIIGSLSLKLKHVTSSVRILRVASFSPLYSCQS